MWLNVKMNETLFFDVERTFVISIWLGSGNIVVSKI